MKRANGFLLQDALLAFFILVLCASLLISLSYAGRNMKNLVIDEKISSS